MKFHPRLPSLTSYQQIHKTTIQKNQLDHHPASIRKMSDQNQNTSAAAATKDVEQKAETALANDGPKTEKSTGDSATEQGQDQQQQQTGPGPKVLRSHFRGMPKQWEKNLRKYLPSSLLQICIPRHKNQTNYLLYLL